MWRGRPRPRKAPTSTAVQSDHAILKPLSFRAQLYRLRLLLYKEEYGKKIDNDFRFGNRVVYPSPLIYAFHRFSVRLRSKILSLQDLHVKS